MLIENNFEKYAFLFKITSKNMHKSKKYPRKICKNDIMGLGGAYVKKKVL